MAQDSQSRTVPPPTKTPREYNPERHCGHRRTGGGPCTLPKGHGTDHPGFGYCKRHGGNTAPKKASAAKEMARELAVTYGTPTTIEPIDAILDEINRANGHLAWLALQIQLLEPEALTWSRTKAKSGITPQGDVNIKEHGSQLHGLLLAYWGERDRRLVAAKAALALGIAQRQLDLAQQQAELLTTNLWRLVQDLRETLGLDDNQISVVRTLFGQMLRRLAETEREFVTRPQLALEGP